MDSNQTEKLQVIQQALEKRFPGVPIQVDTIDYGNALRVTFEAGEERYVLLSPEMEDWRQHDAAWWIHRAGHHMKEKLT